jgi:hypothetical protein
VGLVSGGGTAAVLMLDAHIPAAEHGAVQYRNADLLFVPFVCNLQVG